MADLTLFTYQDAVEHAADSLGGAAQSIDARQARRAVHEALLDLTNQRDWWVYRERAMFSSVAPYATGTIAYDDTGGTYENQVTLTGGTWPSWAAYGYLLIGTVRYTVATRQSDTVLTLSPLSNPGADVAAGTSYTLVRDTYPVPTDFRKMLTPLFNASTSIELTRISDRDSMRSNRIVGTSEPRNYALVGDSNYQGGLGFELCPGPASARTYEYIYVRSPRRLKIEAESTGTVTVTTALDTVIGSGTAFTDDMVGAVIRISSSTTAPTGLFGENRYDQERVILSVESATSLTVDAPWTASRSAVAYVVSDPVDIEPASMLNAYKRGIEAKLGHLRGREDQSRTFEAYLNEVRQAAAADARDVSPRGMTGGYSETWQQWRLRHGTVS